MLRQFILLLFLVMTISTSSYAQDKRSFTLSGVITDTSGEALAGSTISLPELRIGAVADDRGHYNIRNIPSGTYLVNIRFLGYHSIVKDIKIDRDVSANFQLSPAVTEEKEVVVVSSLPASSIKRNPVPIAQVSKTFLDQNLSTNVVSAIANIPGVSAVTTGPNVAKPFIRGLGFNRVLTLFDGIRQEGQQWGNEHGVEIDENMVDHIEVIKGPASLLYGSDAIAGVVNFIPPGTPPKGVRRGEAQLRYGSNNNLLEGALNLEGNNGVFSWNLIGVHKMGMNYKNKIDGSVYQTGFKESSLFFQSAIHKKWGYSRIGLSYFDDLQEIPDGERDSATRKFTRETADGGIEIVPNDALRTYKISDQYQHIRHFKAYNITNFVAGNGRIETQLGYQKNIREEFEDPGSDDASLHMDLNTVTYGVTYFSPRLGRLRLTGGLNGMYQTNVADKGTEFLIPNYHQFDAGPFIYAKISGKKSEWAGGLRYDLRSFNNESLYVKEIDGEEIPVTGSDREEAEQLFPDFQQTFKGFTGSIGFTHEFDRHWNLKMNVARGFRAPNISEISSNGIHAGDKIYQLGNRHFKPEFSFQQDLAIAYQSDHVSATASIFNNNIQNYIFNQKLLSVSGGDSIIVPGIETFQYTASRANLHGGEFSIDVHPHPLDWLHFENSISMVFAKNRGNKNQAISDEERYLPFIMPMHWRSELRGNFDKWASFAHPYVKFQADIFARQNRVFSLNGTETPTAGYQLFNLGAGGSIVNKKGRVVSNVNIMVNNIFNTAYQSHLSRLKYFEPYPTDPRGHYGLYGMGRNVSVKVSVPFNL